MAKLQTEFPTRQELGFKSEVNGFHILQEIYESMRDEPKIIARLNKCLKNGEMFFLKMEIYGSNDSGDGLSNSIFFGTENGQESLSWKHKLIEKK